MSHYYKSRRPALLGDDTAASSSKKTPSVGAIVSSPGVKTASAILLTYHGYRRTGSIVWALLYGLAGRAIPVVAVPVAVAQGIGKRRICTTEE